MSRCNLAFFAFQVLDTLESLTAVQLAWQCLCINQNLLELGPSACLSLCSPTSSQDETSHNPCASEIDSQPAVHGGKPEEAPPAPFFLVPC